MKKTDQSKSTIVTVSVLGGLVVLGSLGYIMMFGNKNKKRDCITSEEKTPETSVEPSRQENMNDVDPELLNSQEEKEDVDEVMKAVSNTLLERSNFNSREEFLKEFVRSMWKVTINPKWFDHIPKGIDELEELLKKYKLYEKYKNNLFSSAGIDSSKLSTKKKQRRIDYRIREVREASKDRSGNYNRLHTYRGRNKTLASKRSRV